MANKIKATLLEPVLKSQIAQTQDSQDQKFIIPMDGKLILADDPASIGKNFQQLTNMRYKDTHPVGINGMTKINSSPLGTYKKVRSGIQLVKEDNSESHILLQGYNSDDSAHVVIDYDTYPPTTGSISETPVWTDSSGSTYGNFSLAPNGHVAYCNGVDTCLWGGDEVFTAALITSSAAVTDTVTSPKDFSDIINNESQESDQTVTVGGGIDTYTMLCCHFDGADNGTTYTDSSTYARSATRVGTSCVTDTAAAKFGVSSFYNPGGSTGANGITFPDSSDWYMGTGTFTIDCWIKVNSYASTQTIFQQYASGTSYAHLTLSTLGALEFKVVNSSTTIQVTSASSAVSGSNWHHIAVIRGWGGSSTSFRITVDGVSVASSTDSDPWHDIGGAFGIGVGNVNNCFNGWIDEFTVSKGIARWTAAFSPPSSAYASSSKYILIGSLRPLQGIKFYVTSGGGNTIASTLTCSTWNGFSWETLTVTDNTDTGAALAQTGTVTFPSTVSTSKLKYIEGYLLYWYQLYLNDGFAEIYKISLDAPFQQLLDIWDGLDRFCGSFYLYKAAYQDYTINVYEDTFASSDSTTFVELDSLTATTQYVIAGFTERLAGININVAPGHYNTTASTDLSVYYWDGGAWSQIAPIVDGTAEGGISLAKSGTIYWNTESVSNETKRVIKGGYPLYYYKLVWDAAMSSDVQLYYVSGIPRQATIAGYSYPLYAADRLMLLGNTTEYGNKILISAEQAPSVMNGDFHYEIFVGDSQTLVCGCSIFAQYASNIYNMVLLFKKYETWLLAWDQSSKGTTWSRFRVSDSIGCLSPKTLQTANVTFENNMSQTKSIAIWQSHDGIYMSEGRSPMCISKDIESLFDQNATTHINLAMISKSVGFIDRREMEYHWLFASGSSTTLDKEYVLDLKKWKWFEIDRSTKDLQFGMNVLDVYGNSYTYGFIDTGYCERLEYGYTLDGTAIDHTLMTGDMVFIENDILAETRLERFNLVCKQQTSDTSVALTHYKDTETSGDSYTIAINDSTHRLANVVTGVYSAPSVFHAFKLVNQTDGETAGFEPIYIGAFYRVERDHI